MKPIPNVLASPWCIEPGWMRVVFGVWSRGQLDAPALAQAKADWEARTGKGVRLEFPGAAVDGTGGTLRVAGDVGLLSIEGLLFRHANMLCDFSGGTTYEALARGLRAALDDRRVASILLCVNSPGGEASGVNALAKAIADAREQKPVHAYVDGMCASAAYWLASQAETITAEELSEIGSIGAVCGMVDDSAANEAAGIREIELVSSQSPGKRSKPIDEDVIGRRQTRLNNMADIFVGAVARGRGVSANMVLSNFGQGDVMIAAQAVDAGLIDALGSFSTALDLASGGKPTRQESIMAKIESAPQAAAGGTPEWQCAGCAEMMGPSARSYCGKCAEDSDDDEDQAKALGIGDVKASADARRLRMVALAGLERELLAVTGAGSTEKALAMVKAGVQAQADIVGVQAEARRTQLRARLERGVAGAPGETPKLSLGALQKSLHTCLRGDAKKGWVAAMDKVAADADASSTTVSAAQLIDAACSVAVSADDVDAIADFIASSAPVAAPTHAEPARSGEAEAEELDPAAARIKKTADKVRAHLDRNAQLAAK